MTDPTERAAGANPEAGRDDEPKDAGEYAAVIKLPTPGMMKLRSPAVNGIAHRPCPLQ